VVEWSPIWACYYNTLQQAFRNLVCASHPTITHSWTEPRINTLCLHRPFYVGSNSNAISSQLKPKPRTQCCWHHFRRTIPRTECKMFEPLCCLIMSVRTCCENSNVFTHTHTQSPVMLRENRKYITVFTLFFVGGKNIDTHSTFIAPMFGLCAVRFKV
jgi:hypothetical protein